jgi:hypothetical protein
MSPNTAGASRLHAAGQADLNMAGAQRSLALLANWRLGSLAAAIVTAGLLPFAIAWRVGYVVAIVASIIVAAILGIGCHLAHHGRLRRLAVSPDLADLPDLAATRHRLQGARTRRALAAGLRRTADPIQPPRRFDCCPILAERAAEVRDQLLELANALERTTTPDPVCVALIRELLTNGASPLYNPNLPADERLPRPVWNFGDDGPGVIVT